MISQAYYIESSSLQQGGGRTKVEPDNTKQLSVWGDPGAKQSIESYTVEQKENSRKLYHT